MLYFENDANIETEIILKPLSFIFSIILLMTSAGICFNYAIKDIDNIKDKYNIRVLFLNRRT